MKIRWEVFLIFVICVLLATVLYLLKQEPIWTYLAILAGIVQLVGFTLRDLFKDGKPEIIRKRKYRAGPIEEEEVQFIGRDSLAKYVNGSSILISERSVPAVTEIATAIQLEKEGKYNEADVKASEAISLLISSPINKPIHLLCQAYLIRGDVAFNKKRFSEAEQYYDSSRDLAILINDDFLAFSSARGLAIAKGSQGNHAEALRILEQILKGHSEDSKAWCNRGVALQNLDKPHEALASYEKAIALNPNFVEAWCNRGVILDILDKDDEALASYDEAIALNPSYDQAWYNKGLSLAQLHEYGDALASLEKAIALDPSFAEAWTGKGIALAGLGKHHEAKEALDRALQIDANLDTAKRVKRDIEDFERSQSIP